MDVIHLKALQSGHTGFTWPLKESEEEMLENVIYCSLAKRNEVAFPSVAITQSDSC